MYSLRPRLTKVNYRTLSGVKMSDSGRNNDESDERVTEESNVPSDQDLEEIPDNTIEELEALIAQETTKLSDVKKKAKLAALQRQLTDLRKETLAEQHKLDRATGVSKQKKGHNPVQSAKTKNKTVSSKDLRAFEGLSQEVEKHLSEMGLGAPTSLAAADASTSSDDDSSSEHTSRSRKTRGKRDLKSGKTAKIASHVVRRQFWPHSELSMGYVTKDIGYDELSLEEFVAGYSAILLLPQVSSRERLHRTEHLGALMYLASIYEWPAVRSFHAAVLLEIERGRLNWGDSFLHLENRTLAGSHRKVKAEQKRPAPQASTIVLFCREYQRGSCSHTKDHYAMLRGEKKWLCHICAACWVKDKVKRVHSEYSNDCPNKPKPQE